MKARGDSRVLLRMRHAILALVLGLCLGVLGRARDASAGASPMPPPRDPSPYVRVTGPAEVRDAKVAVDCAARRIFEISAGCKVKATLAVAATGPVTLHAMIGVDEIDLGAPGHERALAAGEVATITIVARRSLSTSYTLRNGPFIIAPMVARHMFLGSSATQRRVGGEAALALVSGGELVLGGAPALDADGDGRVTITLEREEVEVDRASGHTPWGPRPPVREGEESAWVRERRLTVRLAIPARANASGLLHHGGPVLAGGVRDDSFLLRGAYEVSLGEYVFLSASVETDFDSIIESLVIDVSTPEVIVFLPSLRLGTGVVARQLGPRPADVGVRLRGGGNLAAIGLDMDLDYWPAIDDWTVTGTFRVSL